MTLPSVDGYSYYINPNDSDEDAFGRSSSDEEELDEVDVFLYGTPKQQRKALKNLTGDEASSDENFEEVMNAELEQKVKAMENKWKSARALDCFTKPSSSKDCSTSKPHYYDDVYFDSDEEDKSKRQRLTDDELFYDPKADDEDQKWADKRLKRHRKKKGDQKHDHNVVGNSDAVLSCPACMTILCMDCQQHSFYQNQFRAMFVMNCKVQIDEVLHYREKRKKEFKRHKKKCMRSSNEQTVNELPTCSQNPRPIALSDGCYHPVKCTVCQTEVAVYDEDEVYHFFNVLAGHA